VRKEIAATQKSTSFDLFLQSIDKRRNTQIELAETQIGDSVGQTQGIFQPPNLHELSSV